MVDSKPCTTPINTLLKLYGDTNNPVSDPTHYCKLTSTLSYLTFTHPDISYMIQQVYLHLHYPRESHMTTLKRILRYLQDTMDFSLLLHRSSTSERVAYYDVDWVGCPDTRRSNFGYVVFLGDNLISWSSKRQNTVSRSSAEA
jgi:hypothetical protein